MGIMLKDHLNICVNWRRNVEDNYLDKVQVQLDWNSSRNFKGSISRSVFLI